MTTPHSSISLGFPKICTIGSRPWFIWNVAQHPEDALAPEKHVPCPREKLEGGRRLAFVALEGGERKRQEMGIVGEKTV